MTAEQKKEWLGRYRKAKIAENEIEMEIEEIENEYMIPAKRMDRMPRGGQAKDLADMAAEMEPLFIKLKEQLGKRIEIYHEIVDAVEHSPISETQRAILRYRYILCLKWEEIEELLHTDRSWLHRQRETAIARLKIKKKNSQQKTTQG